MLKAKVPIQFDLSGLNIQVAAQEKPNELERLPAWAAVSYRQEHGFDRVITATMNITF